MGFHATAATRAFLRRIVYLVASTAMAMLFLTTSDVRGLDNAAVASACGPSWSRVPSAPELHYPRAIAPIAPDDVWIVGSRRASAATGAEHWDGSSWTLVSTLNGGDFENVLSDVDALRSDSVWAVGHYSTSAGSALSDSYKTLVEHWDGTSWKVVASPNAGVHSNTLTGVDALEPDLAWAVGYFREGGMRKTLVQRWDGASWGVVPSPNPGTASNALLGVAAIEAENAWAVGYKSSGTGYRALALHYNGTAWEEVGVPALGDGDNVLTGISAVADGEVWAVGYYVEGTQHKPLALYYDGTSWRQVLSANVGDGVAVLRSVDVSSPSDAWAVGLEYRQERNNYIASTQHWDGSSWTAFPSAIAQTSTAKSEMLAVAKAPGTSQVWAAGQYANVETICPSEGSLATTVPAQKEAYPSTYTPAADSVQTPSRPGSIASSVSSAPVETRPGGIPVIATDQAVDAGIYELTKTRGAVVADLNNDGLEDIFLGRHQGKARLYANDGDGHFTEIETSTFRPTDRHGCDAADVNNDGLTDIFCTVGAAVGAQAKRNELYVQRPDHTFVDRAAHYGVLEPFARGRSAAFIDANGDSYPDLFAANSPDRADGLPSPNRLFVNQSGTAYHYAPGFGLEREVGDGVGTGGNPDAGDLDKDGWEDLLVETVTGGVHVYHNDQGKTFTGMGESVGLGQLAKDATLADVNGDTWPDVIQVAANRLRVLLNKNGTFAMAFSAPLSYGLAAAAGDVNGDGHPDIFVMRRNDDRGANAPDQVYLNDGTGKNFALMASSLPSTSEGRAESVFSIDHDANGLTDFLVLNGEGDNRGPVQLVSFFPDPSIAECTMIGTASGETLAGTEGGDVICGLGGDDTVKGLGGNDVLKGGDGDDTLDGGAGMDAAHFSASSVGVRASLITNEAAGEGSDSLASIENLTGSNMDDELTGSNSSNVLSGRSGADILFGLEGADKVVGGPDNDPLKGGTGNDMMVANGGSDDLFGEEGDDTLDSKDGIEGNDALHGGSETDTCVTDSTEESIVDCERWLPSH